jgi:uncharacterized protein (TIGR00251 family)
MDGSLTLKIKVIPKSPKNEIVGQMADGTLKIRIAAPPEKGRANEELRSFLAGQYNVPAANVTILSGATSQTKLVRITGSHEDGRRQ